MKFLEDILNLPPAWDTMKNNKNRTVANKSTHESSFAQFMKLLKPWELKVLYSILEPDFTLFNYDPCDGF